MDWSVWQRWESNIWPSQRKGELSAHYQLWAVSSLLLQHVKALPLIWTTMFLQICDSSLKSMLSCDRACKLRLSAISGPLRAVKLIKVSHLNWTTKYVEKSSSAGRLSERQKTCKTQRSRDASPQAKPVLQGLQGVLTLGSCALQKAFHTLLH